MTIFDDPEWLKSFEESQHTCPWLKSGAKAFRKATQPLVERLENRTRSKVCLSMFDDKEVPRLMLGKFYKGYATKKVRGRPSECHSNTSTLFLRGKIDAIVTGFALSSDLVWRSHTWGRKGKVLIETTTPRIMYYGYELTGDAAETFVYENE